MPFIGKAQQRAHEKDGAWRCYGGAMRHDAAILPLAAAYAMRVLIKMRGAATIVTKMRDAAISCRRRSKR